MLPLLRGKNKGKGEEERGGQRESVDDHPNHAPRLEGVRASRPRRFINMTGSLSFHSAGQYVPAQLVLPICVSVMLRSKKNRLPSYC